MTSKVVSYKKLFSEFISASDLLESKIVEQLHEEIGSDLMALKLKLSASDLMEEVKNDVDDKINCLLMKIKELSNQFYPAALDELGLKGALRACVRKCNHFSNVTVNFKEVEKADLSMPIETQRQLYYITEEILLKIIDQSKDNAIEIEMNEFERDFELKIADKENISRTILTNEVYLTDLGIQKMHSRIASINAKILYQDADHEPKIKILVTNG